MCVIDPICAVSSYDILSEKLGGLTVCESAVLANRNVSSILRIDMSNMSGCTLTQGLSSDVATPVIYVDAKKTRLCIWAIMHMALCYVLPVAI